MAGLDASTPRRAFLAESGEVPILPDSLAAMLRRRWEFQDATGLDDEHTHTGPLSAVPLPVYFRARWSGVPEFMWNPLAWLPPALSAPVGTSPSAVPAPAVRVWEATLASALGMSGLYAAEGGWVDVAAVHGIDLSDPAVLLRAQAWCAGGADGVFDAAAAWVASLLLGAADPAAAATLLDMLPVQRAHIAEALCLSLSFLPDPIAVLPEYLLIANDLLGEAEAFGPYLLSDVLRGMAAEVRGPDREVLAPEALDDFRQLLQDVSDGSPIGGR